MVPTLASAEVPHLAVWRSHPDHLPHSLVAADDSPGRLGVERHVGGWAPAGLPNLVTQSPAEVEDETRCVAAVGSDQSSGFRMVQHWG